MDILQLLIFFSEIDSMQKTRLILSAAGDQRKRYAWTRSKSHSATSTLIQTTGKPHHGHGRRQDFLCRGQSGGKAEAFGRQRKIDTVEH